MPFINGSMGRGYYAFFFGLILANYVHNYGITKRTVIFCLLAIAGLAAILVCKPEYVADGQQYVLTFLMYPAIIIVFDTDLVNKLIPQRAASFLGAISYDVYIWHCSLFLLMYIVMREYNLTPDLSQRKYMYLFTLISLIVGVVSYFLLERPLGKWIDWEIKRLRQRKQLRCSVDETE